RVGPKPIMMLGFVLISIGGFGLIWLNHILIAVVILPMLVLVGIVGVLIAMSNVIVLSVSPKELGIQTGMNQTFRNLGSAIGPVLVASILASFTTTYLLTYSGGTIPVSGFTDAGFQTCFAAVTLLGVVGFGFSLALRNYRFAADGTREDAVARNGAPPMPRAGEGTRPELVRPAPPAPRPRSPRASDYLSGSLRSSRAAPVARGSNRLSERGSGSQDPQGQTTFVGSALGRA
ncbi:major facilitator transporter, partial [mine drainage metagenome]